MDLPGQGLGPHGAPGGLKYRFFGPQGGLGSILPLPFEAHRPFFSVPIVPIVPTRGTFVVCLTLTQNDTTADLSQELERAPAAGSDVVTCGGSNKAQIGPAKGQ